MTKKRFASSAHARQRAKNARHMPDSMLDLTDIPEATDAQLRRARRVGRAYSGNATQLTAIRCAASSVMRWRNAWRRHGADALKVRFSPGRPRRLTRRQEKRLVRILLRGALVYCPVID